MSENRIEIRCHTREIVYSLNETAKLARVTTEFIIECEREWNSVCFSGSRNFYKRFKILTSGSQ
jgi:hypothetical protein